MTDSTKALSYMTQYARPILVDYDPKPIPDRRWDYVAARDGSDPECCHVGYGATEQDAIDDLLELEGEE